MEARRDLSPYEGALTADEHGWLQRLSRLTVGDFVISLNDNGNQDDQPIIERHRDGSWWAGRYIGAITFEERRLVIAPRLGIPVIEAWLDQILGHPRHASQRAPRSSRDLHREAAGARLVSSH